MRQGTAFLAVDLGTTTLAGRLLGADGAVLAEARHLNPQALFGADIIRRLEAARGGEGGRLQGLLVEGIASLVAELLTQASLPRRAIAAAAAAGNPGISYLLRNLPVDAILFPPHRPAEHQGVDLAPETLGLDLPVPLYLFPLVSGYVGGDLVAFVYSRPSVEAGTFFLDIGTNGEMALFDGTRWWVTSVAAGPAFEGGGISCGIPLAPGAVTDVAVEDDKLKLTVQGGASPRGLCGSGLAAAVAAALDGGLIDSRGTIASAGEIATNLARHIVESPAGRGLRLHRDAAGELLLTQEDIRNFQLAKGAILAGVECLLQRAGLRAEEVRLSLVTGAFGFSLAPAVLKRVAILPKNMVDKVVFVPGGALLGVGRFLLDPEGRTTLAELAARLKPYPLSGTPAFEQAFLRAIDF
ncbi:hypothetical protein DSOUD_2964 [Desulfuromonas soudanensis]|uniref:DUF4445 domain-containing protein n=1 Tax=Desulfuromonas soudanensis TaxID=1603606 RepID=A0A0M4DBF2_9BACT|nr:ASKHA domain-containing protein [Desulfuromonas soudanensis]ALC17692.1 hypothetical protein DSOUD_2964 [Desulfuromonas soudanensis]